MTTVEEHSIATQCDADTTISVSRCSVCGYELISDNMTLPCRQARMSIFSKWIRRTGLICSRR